MDFKAFYASRAWRALRAQVLREQPVCQVPGCGQASGHVDHRTPMSAGGAPLARENVQALCHGCHSSKTARFDGGHGNPRQAGSVRAKGCTADGAPRDPLHHWHRPRPAGGRR